LKFVVRFTAPEVLLNSVHVEEADMWSVGVIVFVMLCGNLPYDGETKNQVLTNIKYVSDHGIKMRRQTRIVDPK
jgi:serine/threonine protein kinase